MKFDCALSGNNGYYSHNVIITHVIKFQREILPLIYFTTLSLTLCLLWWIQTLALTVFSELHRIVHAHNKDIWNS